MQIYDARTMTLDQEYKLSQQYPPRFFEQFGIAHTDHITMPEDITRFTRECQKQNAVVHFISNYGQYGYRPIPKAN